MEERKREQKPAPVAPAPVPPPIPPVAADARERVAPGERALAEAFARQFATAPGAEAIDDRELTALAMVAFRFVADRSPEEPRVRVFDADLGHEGWLSAGTVLQVTMRERPFIASTVRLVLEELDCQVRRLLAPVFSIERDPRRIVLAVGGPGAAGSPEVVVHIEIDRVPEPQVIASLLGRRLSDLILAVDDSAPMRSRMVKAVEQLRTRTLELPWREEADAAADFLEWLDDDRFIVLGYREYEFEGQGSERTASVRRGSGLGILQSEDQSRFTTSVRLTDDLRRRVNEPPLLMLTRTSAESPVHRRGFMDYIGLKEIDEAGVVVGERRWIGLFTDAMLAAENASAPLLRDKLARVLSMEGLPEDSDEATAIRRVFNGLPKVDVLALGVPDLRSEIQAIRAAARSGSVQVSFRFDALDRGTFALVTLPQDRFTPPLFAATEQRLVRVTNAASVLDRTLRDTDGELVRMHFYLNAVPETVRTTAARDLEAPVLSVLRTWEDRLRDELGRQFDRHRAAELGNRYLASFPPEYRRDAEVQRVVRDIELLEELRSDRLPRVDVLADEGSARQGWIRIYCVAHQMMLGELVTSLANLGLTVLSAQAVRLPVSGIGDAEIHDLRVQDAEGAPLEARRIAPLLGAAIQRMQRGRLRDDRLNALIVRAQLDWRQVDVLRLYVDYAAQLHEVAARDGLEAVLLRFPQSARLLWEYFTAKFDPLEAAPARDRLVRVLPEIEQRFTASLQSGQSPNETRLLRLLFGIVRATVRTNFFRASASGSELMEGGEDLTPLAVKIESARVPEISGVRPLFELFVDGFGIEGIYARGGRISRGGVFFLDAPDQLRMRVLDRLRDIASRTGATAGDAAQGAFTVRREGRSPVTVGQVQLGYRTFLSALVGLTDDIEQGRVTPPPGTVLYDDPDPYLHLSDTALGDGYSDAARVLVQDSGFWIGEAIVAGGQRSSAAEVAARGAWESVRRHFLELGRDADRETVSVVAIGRPDDAAFLRGLLLSRRLQVRAALDDQWILLDPDSDPSRSFVERERLASTPSSTWAHYDRATLSDGGGLFPRSAAKIELHPVLRGMLGIDRESASGDEIARAVLRLEADLLWCGDAGIYAKSAQETHAEVGDAGNDPIRVDATELRCRVAAEVGPAFTHAGRVTFAVAGGRINGAPSDSAAAIVLDDRESNVRIAVAACGEGSNLSAHEQSRIVQDVAPYVAGEVLADSHHRVRALHREVVRSQRRLDEFFDLLAQIEADKVLDRRLERLPDRETVRRRRAQLNGLTRPELAIFANATKSWLRRRLLATDLPDDPFFERYLREYFPQLVNDRCGQGVRSHRLRRSIIASQVVNAVVDRMGVTFVTRVANEAGVDPVFVIRAWAVLSALCGADELWREVVDTDPPLPVAAEDACWDVLNQGLERATRWMVFTQPPDAAATVLADTFTTPARELLAALTTIQPATTQQKNAAIVERIAAAGVPRALPQRLVPLLRLVELLDIVQLAIERGRPHSQVGEAYYRIDDLLELDWIEQRLSEQPSDDPWAQRALDSLREELISVRRELTEQVLTTRPEAASVEEELAEYLVGNEQRLRRIGDLMDDVTSAAQVTFAALLVIVRELRRLSEGT